MSTFLQKHRNWVIALAVAVIAFMMSAYVVPEEEQVVIIRTGQPVGTVNTPNGTTGAGIYFRMPIIERVSRVEKRLLDLEMTDEEVLSADQQRLLVNAYARFRITDPVRMVERAGSTDGVRNALEPILNSVLRQELGRRTFQAMLTAEREARTIRAGGSRDARIIRAEADAEGARIYAEAFGKDAEFYDFYRAMQSYDATFSNGDNPSESSIILSPDNEYLRQFRGRR